MRQNNTHSVLSAPIELPCGAVLKNRLIKSAMSDSLADGTGNPVEAQIRLYERWAQGGVALSLIGEVQCDPRFPEKPGNLVLGPESDMNSLKMLTARASVNGAHIWPQLGHAGALSHKPISVPAGPSALEIGDFKCAGLSRSEIQQLPESYARAAAIAKSAGFTGVQIHCGHGFLLSQFLSPLFNHRTDQYGGSIEARCRIIVEIIQKVRLTTGPAFPIGIKINSSDQLKGGLSQKDALEAIRILSQTSIDIIEISGGTYFPGAEASLDRSVKGPYFTEFAQKARQITHIPLITTGGFKTRAEAVNALSNESADIVGIARAMVLNPLLANDWMSSKENNPDFPVFQSPPSGGVTAWYTMLLTALAYDNEANFDLSLLSAIQQYEERDKHRCIQWKNTFRHQ